MIQSFHTAVLDPLPPPLPRLGLTVRVVFNLSDLPLNDVIRPSTATSKCFKKVT